MAQAPSILGPNAGKRAVRLVVTVGSLLILRAILDALPMLKNASALDDTLLSPLVITKAVVDTLIFAVVLRFGVGVGRSIHQNSRRLPDLGRIASLTTLAIILGIAYAAYKVPVACIVFSPTDVLSFDAAQIGAGEATQKFGFDWSRIQDAYRQFAGQQIKMLTGDNLSAFQQLAAVRLTQSPDIYGWVFLVFVAVPVVGIVVLTSRNLDTLTEVVFHAVAASPGPVQGQGVGSAASSPQAGTAEAPSIRDVGDKLTKLKALLDSGLISKEDFDGQKKVLLEGSSHVAETEELRKLKALLDAGALTQEEYNDQKRRFLARL
jgi:hypothetical protein